MNEGGDGGPSAGLDIQKLPETKTGLKLRQNLSAADPILRSLMDPDPTKPQRKLVDLDLEYRSVISSTNELYKAIEMSSGLDQTVFLYTVFNVLDNIINYPYSDD